MSKSQRLIVFSDGVKGYEGDFPVAVFYDGSNENNGYSTTGEGYVVDPIFNDSVTRNLFGRIMTLVEATTETSKLKAVKDLFGKELDSWASDVYSSAREIANGGNSSRNIYNR